MKLRLARFFIGSRFSYIARFAGGSIVSITYGPNQRFLDKVRKLPTAHILWGCIPLESGASRVHAFVVQKKERGLIGLIKKMSRFFGSILLLAYLHDDDVKAYPRMRFNPINLIGIDQSAARLILLFNGLKKSSWTLGDPHVGS